MKKIIIVGFFAFLLSIAFVFAHAEDNFTDTKKLLDSNVGCDKLSDTQLEGIGEYYMEQMHPGESHEKMHEIMGFKNGTGAEEEFHINLAKAMYCGTDNGMMGMHSNIGMMMPQGSGGETFSATNVGLIAAIIAIVAFAAGWFGRNLLGKNK